MEAKRTQFSLVEAVAAMLGAAVLLFLTIQYTSAPVILLDCIVFGYASYRGTIILSRGKSPLAGAGVFLLVLISIACFAVGLFAAGLSFRMFR
jgi:hypothetical protein